MGLLVTIALFPVVGLAVSRLVGLNGGQALLPVPHPRTGKSACPPSSVQPYLAGAGAVGALLFLLNLAGVPLLVALAVILAATAAVLLWRRGAPGPRTTFELVPDLILIALSAWLLFLTAIVPLDDYDGRAFWLLKAKAIAHEKQVDGPFFQQQMTDSPRNQYPLLVPADAAVAMLAGRELDDRHVRWLYALFAIAFALEVRRRLGAWPAAVLLCLPEILRAANTASSDVALGAFAAAAFFTIAQETSPLQLGFWLACAVLTKSEGLPLAALLLVAGAFVFRKRIVVAAAPFAVSAGALLLWRAKIHRSDEAPFAKLVFDWAQHLRSLRGTLAAFGEQLYNVANWGGFWIAVVIALAILSVRKEWRTVALTTAVLIPMIALYAVSIAVTDFDLAQMDGLARRLLTHLLGPAIYALAAVLVQAPDARQVVGERQHEEHP
jgi:hypothetical protein